MCVKKLKTPDGISRPITCSKHVFLIFHILAIYDININLKGKHLKRIKNINMYCTRLALESTVSVF